MTSSSDSFKALLVQQAAPLTGLGVLQVLPALGEGGVEQSAEDMAFFLQRYGIRAFVAARAGHSGKALARTQLLSRSCAGFYDLKLDTKLPWTALWNAVRLVGIIRREKIALVHARSRMPAWSAWLACLWTGVPFVATFHGTYGLGRSRLKRFYNSVMLRGRVVIANSLYIRSHLIEKYDVEPHRIVVAQRGVNLDAFHGARNARSAVFSEWNIPAHVPVLMLVGRLTRWKGQDVFVRALATIADLDWHAVLVGGPDKRGAFAQELTDLVSELGLTQRVTFAGSRNDVPSLLGSADIALSCSVQPEAFGRVAVEAMAMGTPVIATALGGSLETVVDGETGWLVPVHDGVLSPQALGQTLRDALRNRSRLAKMGRAARAHVENTFTVDRCCAAELHAYRLVLGFDPHPAPTP